MKQKIKSVATYLLATLEAIIFVVVASTILLLAFIFSGGKYARDKTEAMDKDYENCLEDYEEEQFCMDCVEDSEEMVFM